MMELTWSPDALDDLDEIYDIIAEDNEDIAYKFVEEIRGVAQNLCYAPKSGMKIPELNDERYREFYHKGYAIVYENAEPDIIIHEVYNQRRIHIRSYNRS